MRASNTTIYCGGEFAKCGLSARVAPRKVVEQHCFVGVGANGHNVAHCFVDAGKGHAFCIVNTKPWVHTNANGKAKIIKWFGNHHAVTVPITYLANEWANCGCSTNFMVVAMNDRSLACNIWMTEQRHQYVCSVVLGKPLRCALICCSVWFWHDCAHVSLRPAVVQKVGI